MSESATVIVSGPTYPLLRRRAAAVRELKRQMSAVQPILERMYQAHCEHGISQLSVVRRDGTWVGPTEQHRHLVNAEPGEYFVIGGRRHHSPQWDAAIYGLCAGAHLELRHLEARIRAAREAVGMVSIMLIVHAALDLVTWDTDESATRAAWRLCLAAAETAPLFSDGLSPAMVWRGVLELMDTASSGEPLIDGRRYAQEWLDHRGELRAALAERHIEQGGRSMSRAAVAAWLGITEATWRAYVARLQAPGPDDGDAWSPATASAYRITSQRGADWWLTTVKADSP